MARPRISGEGAPLSPRARNIGGWLAALLLIAAVAVAVRILGGNADGSAVLPSSSANPSAAPSGSTVAEVSFGTAIDPVTGEVAADTAKRDFAPADDFAYSARPAEPPPSTIYVEVRRTAGGPVETVQVPSPQSLPDGAEVIAFVVPAANLVAEFGTGEFRMLVYAAPDGPPIAEGSFSLLSAEAPPSTSASP
jgi:hypothetical protein